MSAANPNRTNMLAGTRMLNHTELVYAPGERAAAKALFELLGCRVEDLGTDHLCIAVDPDVKDLYDNCLYASEVTAEQWALEQTLARHRAEDPELAGRIDDYWACVEDKPELRTHFGIRVPSVAELEALVARIEAVGGELAGRVRVVKTLRPGDPGSLDPHIHQVWIRTDVCAAGLLALEQQIELQAPVD